MEETVRQTQIGVKECITADTINSATVTRREETDSAGLHAIETADITIGRDSAGRIIKVKAVRQTSAETIFRKRTTGDRRFEGVLSGHESETSRTMVSLDKKKKEAETEVKTGIPLECVLGWGLVGLVILLFAGDALYKKWKNRIK